VIDHPISVEHPQGDGPRGPIPQDLVDAFFDRELDEGSRERFFKMLRSDLEACAQVAKTQRMLSQLRENIDTPDLTGRIMGELSARDRFLPARLRKMVKAGRLAVAACLLLGVLGVAGARRAWPDAFRRVTNEATPVSDVIASGRTEAAAGVQVIADAMNLGGAPEPPAGGGVATARGTAARRGGAPTPMGMLSLKLSPGATSVTIPKLGDGAIVVYTGSGPENRFIVPESLYMDRATAMVTPLGYISPTRLGPEWMQMGRDSLFVLPPVEGAPPPAPQTAGVVRVRVLRPAELPPEKP
jgi:hypothetical protein